MATKAWLLPLWKLSEAIDLRLVVPLGPWYEKKYAGFRKWLVVLNANELKASNGLLETELAESVESATLLRFGMALEDWKEAMIARKEEVVNNYYYDSDEDYSASARPR